MDATSTAGLAIAAKRALIDRLKTAEALAGVQVAYSYPGRNAARDYICGGRAQFTQARTGYGRSREGKVTITLFVVSRRPNGSVEDVEDRCAELGGFVEVVVADNSRLGDLDGVRIVDITEGSFNAGFDDDDAACELQYTVTCATGTR